MSVCISHHPLYTEAIQMGVERYIGISLGVGLTLCIFSSKLNITTLVFS